jgi:hypothetical protein
VPENLAAGKEICDLLRKVLSRLDMVEGSGASLSPEVLKEIENRLEQSDRTLRSFMQTMTLKLDALAKSMQDAKSTAGPVTSPSAGGGERKRGLLEKLFRAV